MFCFKYCLFGYSSILHNRTNCERGGEPWGANEIDAALLAIDECQDGYIEEEELVEWFKHDI